VQQACRRERAVRVAGLCASVSPWVQDIFLLLPCTDSTQDHTRPNCCLPPRAWHPCAPVPSESGESKDRIIPYYHRFSHWQTQLVGFIFPTIVDKTIDKDKTIVVQFLVKVGCHQKFVILRTTPLDLTHPGDTRRTAAPPFRGEAGRGGRERKRTKKRGREGGRVGARR
jgi:hypothetical protein